MTVFLKVKNRVISTLAEDITDSVLQLDVQGGEGANFPSVFPFHVRIADEYIEVGGRVNDTLSSLVRGQQGTTAASHSEHDSVELPITAKHLDDITNRFAIVEKDQAYTATASDNKILVDAAGGSITISLPAVEDNSELEYIIKKVDSSSNPVIIDADSHETIDGEETVELTSQYSFIEVACDGTEWHIIGGVNVKLEDLLVQQLSNQEEILQVLQDIETHLALGSDENLTKEKS